MEPEAHRTGIQPWEDAKHGGPGPDPLKDPVVYRS